MHESCPGLCGDGPNRRKTELDREGLLAKHQEKMLVLRGVERDRKNEEEPRNNKEPSQVDLANSDLGPKLKPRQSSDKKPLDKGAIKSDLASEREDKN
jgi:hypothetical protein